MVVSLRTSLIISYKLRNYVYHHEFSKIIFRLDPEKATGIIKCKAEPKFYKFIRDLNTFFLPTLRLFISEFTSNKNFIGMHTIAVASSSTAVGSLLARSDVAFVEVH
jgi:hypothetical protein